MLSGLLLGTALGFTLQRGRFCVTGSFRDLWTIKSSRWFTALMIAISVQAVGIFTLQALGIIALPQESFAWLGTIVGGLIFGFAIVLAGGCATGTYYRAGEGLIGSWMALIMYASFSAIMKTGALSPVTNAVRQPTLSENGIAQTFGLSPWILVILAVAATVFLVRHHVNKPKIALPPLTARKKGLLHLLFEKPWHAFFAAIVVGLIAIAAWPLSMSTGRMGGLGITTPSSNAVNFLVTGDAGFVDWGVFLVLGLLVGSFIAAKGSGEFKLRVPDAQVMVKSLVGGSLMGVGAAIGGGCTIGNTLVETAQMNWQGWVSMVAMILGVGLAAHLTITRPRRSRASALVSA